MAPSASSTSPAIYSPLTSFEAMVLGSTSFVDMPPAVTIASFHPPVPVTVSGRFLSRSRSLLLSADVMPLTFLSGSIPLSLTMTGISDFGRSSPRLFLNALLDISCISLSSLLSSVSRSRDGFRSIRVSSSAMSSPAIIDDMVRTSGPEIPSDVKSISPCSLNSTFFFFLQVSLTFLRESPSASAHHSSAQVSDTSAGYVALTV